MKRKIIDLSLPGKCCSICNEFKLWEYYSTNKSSRTWRNSACRDCNTRIIKERSANKSSNKSERSVVRFIAPVKTLMTTRHPEPPKEINNWEWEIITVGLRPMPGINFVPNTQIEGEHIY